MQDEKSKLGQVQEPENNLESHESVNCTYNEDGPTLQELLIEYIRRM